MPLWGQPWSTVAASLWQCCRGDVDRAYLQLDVGPAASQVHKVVVPKAASASCHSVCLQFSPFDRTHGNGKGVHSGF